jgi:alkylated DNA repair dioxygenase AlkB
VVSLGFRYDYNDGKLKDAAPMPPFLLPLRERAAAFAGLTPDHLEHALITEYTPGTSIGWHRDRPHYDDVIGISLASPCIFRLRRKRRAAWERASIRLDRRSVYLMRGPSRTEWEHSIPAVDALRYSITFRSMREGKRRVG